MITPEFNLLDEPWIRVIKPDCSVTEVSITDALIHAHEYSDLSGELVTQNIAILRVLLAVIHSVFSRVDENGMEAMITNPKVALERWKALWELGAFPEKPIRDYLEHWHERFWLFHPERPFFQVLNADVGTEYGVSKLNGQLSESSNKLRLFPARTCQEKERITYPEAARWLLYTNAYDDTSAKPKQKGLPSPGTGWLGRLGLISAVGNTLFKTLMLNFSLLKDGQYVWGKNKPIWELEKTRDAERAEIILPDNPAQMLTLQSRRLLLVRDEDGIKGYALLGGDFFSKVNAFSEQMTVWGRTAESKKSDKLEFQPRRHDSTHQMWREFPSIFSENESIQLPGVVRWVSLLKNKKCIDHDIFICFRISSVQYGDKDFFVNDVFTDELTFHIDLLSEVGRAWQLRIVEEINKCNDLAKAIGWLSVDICKASGGDRDSDIAKEQFYYNIDRPFRDWLERLDPSQNEVMMAELIEEWHKTAINEARILGEELVTDAGDIAFAGRTIIEEDKKTKNKINRHYSSIEAYNQFKRIILNVYKQ